MADPKHNPSIKERKLRVLDGISIDPQEHLEAKETFSGRLTEEILNVRLQGRKMNELRECFFLTFRLVS